MTEESQVENPPADDGMERYVVRLDFPVRAKSYPDAMRRVGLELLTRGIGELFFRILKDGDPNGRIFQNGEQVSTDEQNLAYIREAAARQAEQQSTPTS